MYTSGFSRPGVLLILLAAGIALICGLGPLVIAAKSPTHAWAYVATGPQAIFLSLLGVLVLVMYVAGVILYTRSKGYSGWLGFWLSLAHVAGFIAMLVLPDINMIRGTSEYAPSREERIAV